MIEQSNCSVAQQRNLRQLHPDRVWLNYATYPECFLKITWDGSAKVESTRDPQHALKYIMAADLKRDQWRIGFNVLLVTNLQCILQLLQRYSRNSVENYNHVTVCARNYNLCGNNNIKREVKCRLTVCSQFSYFAIK